MVDNCYGEFVDTIEPSDVGADMVVGSLIKNPGGGLAPIGGYIAGTKECVENASYRMTCPGLGAEVGASLGVNRSFYQGFFLAPMVTKGALKGAVFAANIYEKLGFEIAFRTVNEAADEKVAFLKLGTLVIETYENKAAALKPGAIDHVAIDVKNIEKVHEMITGAGLNTTQDEVHFLPFWENGVRFFTIEGPNKEKVEFSQYL
jgi:catechol 2,3-dioxygenase-like lactoylglutathione lyase family enzyme